MSALTPLQRREAVRTALLEWIAERPSLAFELDVIHQRLSRAGKLDFNPEKEEIVDALYFLRGSNLVSVVPHAHGATPFYQVTSAGVLAFERGTLSPRPL